MRKLLSRFQVVVYFLLSAPIIPLTTMVVLNALGASESKALRDVGTVIMKYAPTLAAVIVVSMLSGWNGVKQSLGRFLIWRVDPKWFVLAFMIPLLLDDVIPLLFYGALTGDRSSSLISLSTKAI